MQKIITISAVAAVLSLPAFAEIANNATCNTTNLGQSNNNSTANVEANWNANTININWYNGDTRILQNTCTYDGSITLPTEPTKPGYTFAGWRLRAEKQCWEIIDGEECIDKGCLFWSALGVCKKSFGFDKECSSITNETECNGSFASYYFCAWSNGACVPGTYFGGGSSD